MKTSLIFFFLLATGPLLAEQEAFFDQYCYDCHDDLSTKGGLDLTALSRDLSDPATLAKWTLIHDRVESGEMPPKEKTRPASAELTAFIEELSGQLIVAEAKKEAERGTGLVRRMNRTEYEHALRDLLALPLLRVKELLPEDGISHGFDKVPIALDLSHVQMRKYLEASDKALRQAIVKTEKRPETTVWRGTAAEMGSSRGAIAIHAAAPLLSGKLAPGLTSKVQGNPVNNKGNSYRSAHFDGEADSLAVFSGVFGAHMPKGIQPDRFRVTSPGWYRVRFSTWGMRWERGEIKPAIRSVIRKHIELGEPIVEDPIERWKYTPLEEPTVRESEENVAFFGDEEAVHVVRASLNGVVLGFFDALSQQPTVHEFEVWLEPGERISFHVMSLPSRGPVNWGSANGVYSYEGPAVVYDWFEFEGPLIDTWPPESQRRLFQDLPTAVLNDDQIAAKKPEEIPDVGEMLRDFADQAFRRPVAPEEVAPYAEIVEAQLAMAETFENAMVAGYKAVLASPDFLFLGLEGSSALASRLSFFLWNSLPDDELRELAIQGELSRPQTLLAQVDRMLADPRSDRFVEHFLDTWLEMKKIDFTTPDPQLYPEFDPWLRDSMLEETRAYFRELISGNLGIEHVIDSDFVLANQRLAELYELRGVTGSQLRRVSLPPDSPRGGFLGQSAVLKVTANGTATSPVLRGVWVLERILGIHLQPPPPNIPAVEPDASGANTIRELVEQHRAAKECAGCHDLMDPPGLALENFDVIGTWRENYRAGGRPKLVKVEGEPKKQLEPHLDILTTRGDRKQIRLGGEVDASGILKDGRQFEDINAFRDLLHEDPELLAKNLARQLTIYATGKGYRFTDRKVIDDIVAQTKDSDYGVRSLIDAVVLSPIFRQTP